MSKLSKDTFIYDLLLAYGLPKAAITRLKQGTYNLSEEEGEVLWKKKIFFKAIRKGDLHDLIDEAKNDQAIGRQNPRFLIVTDYKTLLAIDTKTSSSLDIEIDRLGKYFDFFLPLSGLEKVSIQIENPADVKAAEKMAKLYDQIKADNPSIKDKKLHELNVFLSRLLFCYFAEDTEIFEKGSFTSSIASHTNPDGSDLAQYLDRLFSVMNTKDRRNLPAYLQNFPYVNGGLLASEIGVPKFTAKSRKILLECGELNWSEINPDIFGSMIQAVVNPDQRSGMGMHYTSVPNIMKLIKPLFLDSLNDEFEKAKQSLPKIDKLLRKIYSLKLFDPACGSGNFLIIAYKELRKLEMRIFQHKSSLQKQMTFEYSAISLGQFFGIEIDDFAHEIALLSLWLAEHQMNLEFKAQFGKVTPTLPLKTAGKIICGNATKLNWSEVCPASDDSYVYIFGNPPYLGSRLQTASNKEELKNVCGLIKGYKDLDYISCWFIKAADLIEKIQNVSVGFVSTNSINQGEQVSILWPYIINKNIEISFAYRSFKWSNNAKDKAAVICVIIGLAKSSTKDKKLFEGDSFRLVENINPYLQAGKNIVVRTRSKPISNVPKMVYGSMANDDGNLILMKEDRDRLLSEFPQTKKYIKKFIGSSEFIRGNERWCLWIDDADLPNALKIPEIKKRLENVSKHRSKSTEKSTRFLATYPNRFYFSAHDGSNSIIIPRHSSENREYVPIGFLNGETVISDAAQAIYQATPVIFGIVSSRMHMVWMRAVAGRLKTDYRYSSGCVYNTFPFPDINSKQASSITINALNILAERERYSSSTLAELYDFESMPLSLKEAHRKLDEVVEKCYRSSPFLSEEQILEYLLNLYEEKNNEIKEK